MNRFTQISRGLISQSTRRLMELDKWHLTPAMPSNVWSQTNNPQDYRSTAPTMIFWGGGGKFGMHLRIVRNYTLTHTHTHTHTHTQTHTRTHIHTHTHMHARAHACVHTHTHTYTHTHTRNWDFRCKRIEIKLHASTQFTNHQTMVWKGEERGGMEEGAVPPLSPSPPPPPPPPVSYYHVPGLQGWAYKMTRQH